MTLVKGSPELVVAAVAGSSLGALGPSAMVSSCAVSEVPFVSCEFEPALVALPLVVATGDGGAAIMSTSSLASRSTSGSILEARLFKGEEALSGISAAPPIIARWWVVLVNGEVLRMVGWALWALE